MLKEYMEELKKIKILRLEEEKQLWLEVDKGNEEARCKLIISYQPLVFRVAMSFNVLQEQQMELVQEGVVGLIEAVERFDHERGVAFSLFAVHRIKGRMLDYLKALSVGNAFCLEYALSETDTILDRLSDSAAGPEEIVEKRFIARKVSQVLTCLPEKEEQVLRGIYLEHISADALAEAIQVSKTHIYRLQKQGIRRVRGMLSRFIHELNL